jgi:hypothetical protein
LLKQIEARGRRGPVVAAVTRNGAAVAEPHEEEDLTRRHGAPWSAYLTWIVT